MLKPTDNETDFETEWEPFGNFWSLCGNYGFLSFFRLHQKCQGFGAWWELLICKGNFIVMRTDWTMGYLWMQEISTFPHHSLSASRTLIFQNVWFPVCLESPAFLCPWTLAVYKMPDSLPPFLCSHLTTCHLLTVGCDLGCQLLEIPDPLLRAMRCYMGQVNAWWWGCL